MNIYDIDFNLQATNLDTPTRRLPKFTAFLYSLMKPLQYLRDLFFNDYVNGAVYNYILYNNSTSYTIGNRVIFTNRKVYECISNTVGNNCLNKIYWTEICSNFIGLNERGKYNSQIIIFELHLNKWFFNEVSLNRIYIKTNTLTNNIFAMDNSSLNSSYMSSNSIFSTDFMPNVASFPEQFNFTIYFPTSLYNSLESTNINRDKIIRNYADNYVLAGINYNIITY
jgi:hypothetical protein